MKIHVITPLLVLLLLSSCESQKEVSKIRRLPQIKTSELLQRNIIPINDFYKDRYYSMLPYLCDNSSGDFVKVLGDYFSLKHPKYDQVNIMVGYFEKLGKYKNTLLTSVWIKAKNKKDFDSLDIKVRSNLHGEMPGKYIFRKRDMNFNQEFHFTVQIPLESKKQIVEKLLNDYITIIVNAHEYRMFSPEIKFN